MKAILLSLIFFLTSCTGLTRAEDLGDNLEDGKVNIVSSQDISSVSSSYVFELKSFNFKDLEKLLGIQGNLLRQDSGLYQGEKYYYDQGQVLYISQGNLEFTSWGSSIYKTYMSTTKLEYTSQASEENLHVIEEIFKGLDIEEVELIGASKLTREEIIEGLEKNKTGYLDSLKESIDLNSHIKDIEIISFRKTYEGYPLLNIPIYLENKNLLPATSIYAIFDDKGLVSLKIDFLADKVKGKEFVGLISEDFAKDLLKERLIRDGIGLTYEIIQIDLELLPLPRPINNLYSTDKLKYIPNYKIKIKTIPKKVENEEAFYEVYLVNAVDGKVVKGSLDLPKVY